MERRTYIDNLRWMTVLLVLVYHVFYLFNAEGVFGGIGPFSEVQYQDIPLYLVYPWFMLLLFVVAGMSSRWSLEKMENKGGSRREAHRRFVRSRTLKLLVPSTIGLFVYHWMTGWLNMNAMGGYMPEGLPFAVRFFILAFTGCGQLWFIQDLWLFSLLLVVVRWIDGKDRLYRYCGRLSEMSGITVTVVAMALAVVMWLVAQAHVNPDPNSFSPAGLLNLYRPLFYFVGYLLGYYLFSHDDVMAKLSEQWAALLIFAVTAAVVFAITYFGQDYTMVSTHRDTNIFAWFAVLAALACGHRWLNGSNAFSRYLTQCSYGIYIVHYLPALAGAFTLRTFTSLPAVAVYAILVVSVFAVSVALYETIRRIPFLRWALFGMKRRKSVNTQ